MDPGIVDALTRAARANTAHGYPPFRGVPAFFDAIERFMATRFGVALSALDNAVALSGAKEGIAQLITATCAAGDVVLVPEIYYPVYARATWLSGADVRWIPMRASDGFVLDIDAVSADDLRRARLFIANYPNNPTGTCVGADFHERAVAFAARHELLYVSDLAYSELTYDGVPAPSALQVRGALDHVIEFHSFSKTFSMAGLRLGFAVGNTEAIEALAAFRTNVGYGTPTAVQHAGAFALDNRGTIVPAKVEAYKKRRDVVCDVLRKAGWDVRVPGGAMYVWLPVPSGVDDWSWVGSLLNEDGVVVTPGIAFGEGGKGYFRLSLVRDAATLKAATDAIVRRAEQMTK
jgi:LL-diaminopimelate aminotransferase